MDKLRAMQTFVRIVETGSLTGAAESLDTSLTSVVRSLAALEQQLSTRLLNRTTRRLSLTDEGRDYLERCQRLLNDLAEAEQALSARKQTPSGRLRITAPVKFGHMYIAPLVNHYLERYPDVQVELLLLDRVTNLIDEGIDLAIRIAHLPDSTLVALPLGHTRRVLCASPAYLERQGIPTSPGDLPGHRCIRFTGLISGNEWHFGTARNSETVAINDALATNHIHSAIDACLDGIGCGRFLAYQVNEHLASGKLVRLLEAFEPDPIPISLVYPHQRLLSTRIRAFAEIAVPRLRERLA